MIVNVTTFQLTFEWKKNFKNCLHFQEANKSLKNKTSFMLKEELLKIIKFGYCKNRAKVLQKV